MEGWDDCPIISPRGPGNMELKVRKPGCGWKLLCTFLSGCFLEPPPFRSIANKNNAMRIEVVHNGDRRKAILTFDANPSAEDVLVAACNRFRLKPRKFRLFYRGVQLQSGSHGLQDGSSAWIVGETDSYSGPTAEAHDDVDGAKACVTILDGSDVWIDPEAVEQVSSEHAACMLTFNSYAWRLT